MKNSMIRWASAAVFGLGLTVGSAVSVSAAEEATVTPVYPLEEPAHQSWSFGGIFGQYDQAQLQRGYKVYKEVCSACHSMRLLKFRNLADEGGPHFSDEQVKALAAEYTIQDGPDDNGEMFDRPRLPKDPFPSPFANDKAARAANGGALPPDMSLLAKARAVHAGFPWFLVDMIIPYQEQGPDYIVALMNGYQDAPADVKVPDGLNYNPYFLSNFAIAMPKPLSDGQVEYTDGTPQTVEQYSKDVAAFLMWTAEPHLNERKQLGLKVMLFLITFAGILALLKRKIWLNTPH